MGEKGNEVQGGSGVQTTDSGGGGGKKPSDAPCVVCGEPRGAARPCPHCGMD
ncbi:MAG TPA: hypothetical protein VM262_21120 [Acidimicrobiales bacterium]|nr:hypothetical protein [Acidimicrobiales bacterium]